MTRRRRSSGQKAEFLVGIILPYGADTHDAYEYIQTALASERGIRHPDDPMHNLDVSDITIRRIRAAKPKSSTETESEG